MPITFAKKAVMLEIVENAQLKELNSFGLDVTANQLCIYHSPDDIRQLIIQYGSLADKRVLILGGGCNILFTNNFDGIVIHPDNSYISIESETDDYCLVKAGAGTTWDTLVEWAVEHNLGGIENLSLIPGTVGASPVQNIGAYGREAKDAIENVNIVSLADGSLKTLSNTDCQFGYRDSVFKHERKDKYLVDSVVYRLSKKPQFVTHYGSLNSEIEKLGEPSLRTIRQAIINIRNSKLPDPKKIGNVGSFFKNPTVGESEAELLLAQYPDMVTYPAGEGRVKIAAGWMIDHCGLKGYTNATGTAGVHTNQALVLVNLGGATGNDIIDVAKHVQNAVANEFGIKIEPEAIVVE
jgi:UDP-N-acetylmuramate dehydrogenase